MEGTGGFHDKGNTILLTNYLNIITPNFPLNTEEPRSTWERIKELTRENLISRRVRLCDISTGHYRFRGMNPLNAGIDIETTPAQEADQGDAKPFRKLDRQTTRR